MADGDLDFSGDFESLPLSEKEAILTRIEEKVRKLDPGSEALKNLLYRLDIPEKIYSTPRALAEKIFLRELQKYQTRRNEQEQRFLSWQELLESAPKGFWKDRELISSLAAEDFSKISLKASSLEVLAQDWLSYLYEESQERKRCPIRAFGKSHGAFVFEAEVQWTKVLDSAVLEIRKPRLLSLDSVPFSWTWGFD